VLQFVSAAAAAVAVLATGLLLQLLRRDPDPLAMVMGHAVVDTHPLLSPVWLLLLFLL
jgi:hypothetical protein